jgi:hypothetical protein
MAPSDYVDLYHSFNSWSLDAPCLGSISRYISGSGLKQRSEYEMVMSQVITKFKLQAKSVYSLPPTFYIKGHPVIDASEPFYRESIKRAFDGRGTPEECRDALRMAVLPGRCSPLATVNYVKDWFGLDCNTLVGNYLGISSGCAIFAYVVGYGKGALGGGTPAEEASRQYLPLPPSDINTIGEGSVLVTYSPEKAGMKRWEHIALIDTFVLQGLPNGDTARGSMTIVEWGTQGGQSVHVSSGVDRPLIRRSYVAERADLKFWGFASGTSSTRIFLNQSPEVSALPHRTYGVPGDAQA